MNKKLNDVELEKVSGGDIFYIKNHIMKITIYSNNKELISNYTNTGNSYIVTPDENLVTIRGWDARGEYYYNIFHNKDEAFQFAYKNNYSTKTHVLNEWTDEVAFEH